MPWIGWLLAVVTSSSGNAKSFDCIPSRSGPTFHQCTGSGRPGNRALERVTSSSRTSAGGQKRTFRPSCAPAAGPNDTCRVPDQNIHDSGNGCLCRHRVHLKDSVINNRIALYSVTVRGVAQCSQFMQDESASSMTFAKAIDAP